MNKEDILKYILNNKEVEAYMKSITTDYNELMSDLLFQIFKMNEEKLLNIFINGYLEYTCFKIIKRIKYGNISDSEFFYKKKNIILSGGLENYTRVSEEKDVVRNELLYDELILEINKLHWYDKTIFQLYYKDGYNYREISEKTGINIKSVAHNINKTKNFLKNKFKEI